MSRTTHRTPLAAAPLAFAPLLAPVAANASMFKGEALDTVANGMSWVVLILVPVVVLTVFWLVHILPEKIAEKRKHPQAKAIQVLCLLSLVFGGMLWPLAWLWAYSKPVLYKMAYGTDVAEAHHGESPEAPAATTSPEAAREEIERLRARLASLEARLGPGARG
jgi:CBS domain containing-hemolysin-like protein